jgi:hypothetical protein
MLSSSEWKRSSAECEVVLGSRMVLTEDQLPYGNYGPGPGVNKVHCNNVAFQKIAHDPWRYSYKVKPKLNSVAWVRERTILTRRPPVVVKLVPNFADRGCPVLSLTDPYDRILFCRPEPLLFLSSSSSIVLTRLSGSRSRPIISQKIW